MVYTKRDKLAIIELSEKKNVVAFDALISLLRKRPANMIYVEVNGLLYGIISMGDIYRANKAGEKCVGINTCFTSLRSEAYMKAKCIFKDRKNINALPVVDKSGKLLGDYTRWEDLICFERILSCFENPYTVDYCKRNRHVALVKPCNIFKKKQNLFLKFKDILENGGWKPLRAGR